VYGPPAVTFAYRVGADENGLGARLGPLVVTAVLARVTQDGDRRFERKLPVSLRRDLDDSKRLISHGDTALGEAWSRVLVAAPCSSPEELIRALSLEDEQALRAPCPSRGSAQCWSTKHDAFESDSEQLEHLRKQLARLVKLGIEVLAVKSSIVCTSRLNSDKERGGNRFVSDLHAMERLVLAMRRRAGADVLAVCGKVGSMSDYERFFGPLSGILHTELERGPKRSAYRFHGLGEVHFVRDADARDPLVMLASLVGKYVRELLMTRIASYYVGKGDAPLPSGYHDPPTGRFVEQIQLLRSRRGVPDRCFERTRDAALAE
jgi:ribonuclease HII